MNCEKCENLLGDFLDGTLSPNDSALFSAHLEECLTCGSVREELSTIVTAARALREEYVAPSNERAMWLRIVNTIESERGVAPVAAAVAAAGGTPVSARGESFLARLMNKRWELTLPQMTGAVAALILAVSLATALGLQGLRGTSEQTTANADTAAARADNGAYEEYTQRQLRALEYLRQRVEQRQAHWNPRTREAFQRNMMVIDQALNESLQELRRNPHDQISEEMLNVALRSRRELLEEFSEL